MSTSNLEHTKKTLRMLEILREWAVDVIDEELLATARPDISALESTAEEYFPFSSEDEPLTKDSLFDDLRSCIEVPVLTFDDICEAYARKLNKRIQQAQETGAKSKVPCGMQRRLVRAERE